MHFDLVTTPLAKGVSRLEASAGTGKTFTLAGIFLRLLVQEKIGAREILVVTFTEAATAELRDRIRKRLSEALRVLQGEPSADPLLRTLAEEVANERESAIARLRDALEVFDLVSIYTIHGFCQRTLQDNAFESGALFDVELVTDQQALIGQIAADYWRTHFCACDPVLASVAVGARQDPETLARFLSRYLTYPKLELVTAQPPRSPAAVAKDIQREFDACLKAWQGIAGGSEGLINHFTGGKKWATGAHAKPAEVARYAGYLQRCAGAASVSAELWEAVRFFSTSAIAGETAKKGTPPAPLALFNPCEALTGLIEEFVTAHRLMFLQGAAAALASVKQQAKSQSFDDLIGRLAAALDAPSGPALADAVRRRYRAALIDESQDTDPLQWKIFARVFASSADHWLCLIGDPKQAIYAFRGADVHTYVHAAASATHHYSLNTNWRSESALVRAINALFANAGSNCFLDQQIAFEPVRPGPKADSAPLRFPDGTRPAPFQVWSFEGENGSVTARDARRVLPAAVAAEVSRLLSAEVTVGEHRLQPRDIAILVESHRQAHWMQSALHALRIPSVEQTLESVFDSAEARELGWILAAILAPGREAGVKAALTTDLLGLNGTALQALVQDEPSWLARLQQFAAYRHDWDEHGFFFMFMRLLRAEEVLQKLLRFPDAERRITNLLHLAELLEAACKSEHLGPARLVQWLEQRRTAGEAAPEEFQLRLESDEDAVEIITIHRAKGLEYPVVFCPFVSSDAKLRAIKVGRRKVLDSVVLYHDPATGQLSWDLDAEPDAGHARLGVKEQLAERVRLLYVALTRARNRCYLVSAHYERNPATALSWLMRGPGPIPDDIQEALGVSAPASGQWNARWQTIAQSATPPGSSEAGIAVSDLPVAPGEAWKRASRASEALQARRCARSVAPAWFLTSFTQMVVQAEPMAGADPALPDHDEMTVTLEPDADAADRPVAPTGIFALPPGARTGDCLHRILERHDFANATATDAHALIRDELEASNLPDHREAVGQMLENVAQIQFEPGDSQSTLAFATHKLNELEFCFAAPGVNATEVLALIRERAQAHVPAKRPLSMYLRGFIDLVFELNGRYYIVDWKSNLLGMRTEAYTTERMGAAILESSYDLQYHLYVVALHKFLQQRLPGYEYDQRFGGVRYVFLRGLDPARPELGVFHDRPPRERVDQLSRLLTPDHLAKDI